jgi:hypothetical protein
MSNTLFGKWNGIERRLLRIGDCGIEIRNPKSSIGN